MKKIKHGCVFLTFLFLLNIYIAFSVQAEEITTKAELKSFSIDKKVVKSGEKANISLAFTSKLPEIKEMYVVYLLPSGVLQPRYVTLQGSGDKFQGSIAVKSYDDPGLWVVDRIYIGYKDNSSLYICNTEIYGELDGEDEQSVDLTGLEFEVTDTKLDDTPPAYKGIAVDKKTVSATEKVNITLNASDDAAGISIASVEYQSPSGQYKNIDLNIAGNKLTGSLYIDQFDEAGTWIVSDILLQDNNDNKAFLYSKQSGRLNEAFDMGYGGDIIDLSSGNVTVEGTTMDNQPPELSAVAVDRKTAKLGEKVKVTFTAQDKVSGIKSIYASYQLPSGRKENVTFQKAGSKYEAVITIGQYTEPGAWKLVNVQMEDEANNLVFVDLAENKDSKAAKLLPLGNFQVTGTKLDKEAPKLASVKLSTKTAAADQKVTVSVDAQDNLSGIDSITVEYKLPSMRSQLVKLSNISGKYQGNIQIGKYSEPGVWQISSITLRDKAGNYIKLNNKIGDYAGKTNLLDLSAGNFEVKGTKADTIWPKLKTAKVDKATAKAGEKINLIIEGSDELSGVAAIEATYKLPSGINKIVTLTYLNGKYQAAINIDKNSEVGVWKLYRIVITDKVNHVTLLYNNKMVKVQDSNPFEFMGEKNEYANLNYLNFTVTAAKK